MDINQNKFNELNQKLDRLVDAQKEIQREIWSLKGELSSLSVEQKIEKAENTAVEPPESKQPVIDERVLDIQNEDKSRVKEFNPRTKRKQRTKLDTSEFEKIIGENIANKIGIVILVIGAAIGVKYAIDRELISPLARIILGYMLGLGLLGFAFRLKAKYENFSAVLLSGAMAILYFITFSASSIYSILPHIIAFLLMVIFTIFTVLAALLYNRQIIALFGLVGAYAIPFLLGSEESDVRILFAYMSIINIGILYISIRKNWKTLFYSAFLITWALFFTWYSPKYSTEFLSIGLGFAFVFFVIFYITFLAYKLLRKEKFNRIDVALVLLNSFVFYGLGYDMISWEDNGEDYLGLFTVFNAVVHFIVGLWVFKQKLVDKKVMYLVLALVITFLTIAIPVQLSGVWVSLLWVAEAALLLWVARTKKLPFYNYFSYVLISLAIFSMFIDWGNHTANTYNINKAEFRPFFNTSFFVSLLFSTGFGWMTYLFFTEKEVVGDWKFSKDLNKIFSFIIPAVFIFSLFQSFSLEISNLFVSKQAAHLEAYGANANRDIPVFRSITLFLYAITFAMGVSHINFKRFKNFNLSLIISFILGVLIARGISLSFDELVRLRVSYLEGNALQAGNFINLGIRYLVFVAVAFAVYFLWQNFTYFFKREKYSKYFEIAVYAIILVLATSELLHWFAVFAPKQIGQIWVDILWGVYALVLVIIGIRDKKRYLRLAAIVLFGLTLGKLFLSDFYFLDTIARTIVLISLGILLLVISFLYNRFKTLITTNEE